MRPLHPALSLFGEKPGCRACCSVHGKSVQSWGGGGLKVENQQCPFCVYVLSWGALGKNHFQDPPLSCSTNIIFRNPPLSCARVRGESEIRGLGEGFGLLRAHISGKMLQNFNRGRMAAMCLDDACTIQFTRLSRDLHSLLAGFGLVFSGMENGHLQSLHSTMDTNLVHKCL